MRLPDVPADLLDCERGDDVLVLVLVLQLEQASEDTSETFETEPEPEAEVEPDDLEAAMGNSSEQSELAEDDESPELLVAAGCRALRTKDHEKLPRDKLLLKKCDFLARC